MKKLLAKFISAILSSTLVLGSLPAVASGAGLLSVVSAAETITINDVGVDRMESSYIEWNPVDGAAKYVVSYQKDGASGFTTIDDMLIRSYAHYWRADLVGLAEGTYTIKVEAQNSSGSVIAEATAQSTVIDGDRTGFAFHPSSTFYDNGALGAYNGDGTLKSDAKVFYVTADTAKTITTDVVTSSNGATTTCTGIQTIIDAYQKGYDTTPLDFRIIGKVSASDIDHFSSSAQGIQIKGKNSYSRMNITIEGIGEDAIIEGFGFLLRNAGSVELKNFAIMDFMDDGISMDTDNANIWIHNIDLFYGQPGGANDQAKGDGTIDLKGDTQWVTISYNHLWDSGKASLCGMKGETGDNNITYHHNWFDHSDSRHPRIRTMFVHIYNNYYDGNSKYGVGAAMNSSAFVEGNYFENCKHPMMSSLQGSDIMENEKTGVADFSGDGTFSGENGGIIKAYNNVVVGADTNELTGGSEPIYYDSSDTTTNGAATQFDAYLASSRNEQVPSSVSALVGGKTFDNSKVDSYILSLTPESPEQAKETVLDYAGRQKNPGTNHGGSFAEQTGFAFTSADNSSYDISSTLRSAMDSYIATDLVKTIGGNTDGSSVNTTASTSSTTTTTTTTEATTETTTKDSSETTTKVTESSTETTTSTIVVDPSGAATMGTYVFGSNATGGTFNVTENNTDYGNITFNFRSIEDGSAKLRAENATTIILSAQTRVSIDYYSGAGVVMTDGTNTYTFDDTVNTYDLPAGTYTLKGASNSNSAISSLQLTALSDPGDPGSPEEPSEVIGDADGDGSVTVADIQAIIDYVTGKASSVNNSTLADVSGDGNVTAYDAFLIGKNLI